MYGGTWRGIDHIADRRGLGVIADVTAIAGGATEESNPRASSVLGWVSMATGIAGVVTGLAQMGKALTGAKTSVHLSRLEEMGIGSPKVIGAHDFGGYHPHPDIPHTGSCHLHRN